jgi:hypothetical protein
MTDRAAERELERRLGRVVARGTAVAVALSLVGLAAMLVGGRSPLDAASPFGLDRWLADLGAGRAEAFLWPAIVVALGTPLARVVVATVVRARSGDRRCAALGLAVLGVIAVGVVLGLART